ncbi:ATP-binding cassette domain-containing protein [Paenibacillus sp. HJL G12]|uniref:ATP-binding cassette domain-containing protein n=1 Tax=Paenibacillus dendrobii TaxID=2691084 RepID=A0A7X3IN93_9BACL|nr:ABC transporter ATP-binding protein [Paenibacillus dendrobii]MWV46426.1 ATP-binding cassette domain-containing protein [Paenibacillus dendrobii]
MSFLRKYIRKYGKMFAIAVLFLMLEAFCDLLQPTIMSKVIDDGVATGSMNKVFTLGGLMLLVTGIGALSASIRNVISSHVSQRFGAELRSDLFRKIQSLSFERMDHFDRASLVTRLTNDVTQVQNFMNGLMRFFVKAPLLGIGALIMALRLDIHLSVVLAIVVPVVAVLIVMNMKIGFPFFIRVQRALDRVNGVMREYLSGVRVVKAFNRFDYEVDKFKSANDELTDRSMTSMRVMSVFGPGISLVVNFGIIAVLWLGGLRVDNNQMQVGSIIAFINYMTQILFALMMISNVFNMFVRAKASAGRIGEVMVEDSGMPGGGAKAEAFTGERGRIDFERVSFAYAGSAGDPVIRDFTLTCLPGQTVGIIGSTGSGKTSLVHLIPRFYDATSGKVKVNGVDVSQVDPKQLRDSIAIVPQKIMLFTGTVADNLRWGKEDASEEELVQASRMAEAHEFIMASPEGYGSRIGQGGVNFSGGQKQRLSIARALVRKPEILILDDCTSAVDVATEGRIKEALRTYAKGLTCILIAQRITSVMDADQIVVMDRGEMAGSGTHEELMLTCRVYQEIYKSQMGKEMQPNDAE